MAGVTVVNDYPEFLQRPTDMLIGVPFLRTRRTWLLLGDEVDATAVPGPLAARRPEAGA